MNSVMALAASPRGAWGRWLLALDARPKLVFVLLTGLALWRLPWVALIGLLALGWLCCRDLGGFARTNLFVWRTALFFVALWSGLKFMLDIWAGGPWSEALTAALGLGLRLSVILFLGLSLALSTSPRALGAGLAWFLRPLAGDRAWRIALALALMIHFLPLSLAAAVGVNQSLSRRWPRCPWPQRLRLVPLGVLRVLGQATWQQTLAVAARGLDQPSAWRPGRDAYWWEWGAALVPSLVLFAASML